MTTEQQAADDRISAATRDAIARLAVENEMLRQSNASLVESVEGLQERLNGAIARIAMFEKPEPDDDPSQNGEAKVSGRKKKP